MYDQDVILKGQCEETNTLDYSIHTSSVQLALSLLRADSKDGGESKLRSYST